jgi:putative oxidoreductase
MTQLQALPEVQGASIRPLIDRFAYPVGRGVIGLVYLANGVGLAKDFSSVVQLMGLKGVPLSPLLLALTIAVWWAGGVCLIAGFRVRWAALTLLVWTIPVTAFIHNFWAADPQSFQNELTHCLKNVAILGALLCIAGESSRGAAPVKRS